MRRLKLIYLAGSLFCLLLFAGAVAWQYGRIMPFGADAIKQTPSNFPKDIWISHDFDRNGVDETITFQQIKGRNAWKVDVRSDFNYLGGGDITDLVDPLGTCFADLDQDGFDEVIFTQASNDTLFWTIKNIKAKKTLLDRFPILPDVKRLPDKGWQPEITNLQVFEADGDHHPEILFTISTGYGVRPRGVYIWDLQTRTFLYRYDMRAKPCGLVVLNPHRKNPTILVSTLGVNNAGFFDATPSDSASWLLTFDAKLNLEKRTLMFLGSSEAAFVSSPDSIGVAWGKANKRGDGIEKAFLFKVDENGAISRRMEINYQPGNMVWVREWPAFPLWGILSEFEKGTSTFHFFSANLEQHQQFTLPISFNMTKPLFDIDGDNRPELFLKTLQFGLVIVNSEGNTLARIDFHGTPRKPGLVLVRKGKNQLPEVWAHVENGINRITLRPNNRLLMAGMASAPYFAFAFTIWTLAFLAIFLRQRQGFLHFLLKEGRSGLMLIDEKGRLERVNRRAAELLGRPISHLRGNRAAEALKSFPELLNLIRSCRSSGASDKTDLEFGHGAEVRKIRARIHPLSFLKGFSTPTLVELIDQTEPAVAERLQTWSRTARRIAHDIKTPLAAVVLNLDNLKLRLGEESLQTRPAIENDIELMQQELSRIRNMTRQFLKFADLEKPNLQPVALSEIVDKGLAQFRSYDNHKTKFNKDLPPDAIILNADPEQLILVLHVLVENALDALNGQGLITVSATLAQDLIHQQQMVEFEVTDSGHGIPAELSGRIFEPHVTSKAEGTGMGLAIARKIILDHGGEISVHSREGLGTTFRFTVPTFDPLIL
ncbi:MAG TPA: ATP-binding protein [Calditrichia bacterium]|nr:hypothetical protein [Calditrichota bacterium]HQV32779.1 ATP-binding protein [Calditrichia bacterium]